MAEAENELDFNCEGIGSFYYTNDKQIKNMDDSFILAKITEKYPDLSPSKKENIIKQAIILFLVDSKHVKSILDYFDISIHELFAVLYRTYSFIFNTCFSNRIHDIIKTKCYVRRTRTKL